MHANNLTNLLDALTDTSVYVIEEDTHRLLYFNQRCRDMGRGKAVLGAKCHDIWPEVCTNCPLAGLREDSSNHIVCYDPLLKTAIDATANRILWDGDIRAVVITVTPHKPNFEEEQGLYKIKQMYAKSLVTVFDECIIVNLTGNYYVNCQKDLVWSGIPERGDFGVENRIYAQKVLHPDDLERFNECFSREAMLRIFEEGKNQISLRLRRLTPSGSYHMAEFTAKRIDDPEANECWCVLVFRDVQEEYLLEQRRNVETSQLATAAQTAYQMLIAVNLTQNTYHMLEYNRFPVKRPVAEGCFDDLIQTELSTVHPDYRDEFIGKFMRASLCDVFSRGELLVTMTVPHLGDDGAYHWYFTQVVQVKSPYTDDMIEITLSRNIDDERRMQEEALEKERQAKQLLEDALQKAENASKAKSSFLSRMSHDIRTPMNAIVGMTELAKLHIGDEERLRGYLEKIAASGAHLLGLINEVLDVSKIESGTVELEEAEFDLCRLLDEAVELIRLSVEKKGQTVSVHTGEGLHQLVLGDERRLKQVLVNILENASKYTGEGGRISLSVDELDKGESTVGTYRFVVEDNGIGMSPEYIEHIFEPFSRADDSRTNKIMGTGLGMTIVKNIVSIMGGDVRAESEYGKGSRFIVTLCLAKSAAAGEVTAEGAHTDESFSDLRVLLVEDNELNREIAAEMLALLGARVESVENGRLAVEAVCSHPPYYYDIVFMDIQMPVLNGYDAAKEIRGCGMKSIGDLPIIAMTADAFAEDAKLARLAGMNGHLAKPISIEQLKGALSCCIAWKRRSRGGDILEIGD
ncbi:ATP-binding protein [Cloacibacillus porcorum]